MGEDVYGAMGNRMRELRLATLANPNSNEYTIRGRYNDFADVFIPVPLYGVEAVRNQQSRYAQVGTVLAGSTLSPPVFDTGEMGLFEFYSVKIQCHEVLTDRTSADAIFVDDNEVSRGQRHSVLKARLTWYLPPSYIETVDMDIGTGVDVSVGPTNRVTVEILAPDPASIPSVLPAGHREANYNTSVAVNVQCAPGTMSRFTARFTQQVFVETATLSATRNVVLRPDARRIQVLADQNAIRPPQFITLYPFAPAASPTLGRINMEPADTASLVTEIPQGATHLQLSANPAAPAGNTITVVQELLR